VEAALPVARVHSTELVHRQRLDVSRELVSIAFGATFAIVPQKFG